jgi:hypothetical protein
MKDAYAAAARDPQVKVPADRRPALTEEIKVAEKVAAQAKIQAKGAWARMSTRLHGLDLSVVATLDDDQDEAAAAYSAAIDRLEATREAFHQAGAVRRWVAANVSLSPDRRDDAGAGSYSVRVPTSVALPGHGNNPTAFADLVAVLRADASTEPTKQDERRNRFLRLNADRVERARQRAEQSAQHEHARARITGRQVSATPGTTR